MLDSCNMQWFIVMLSSVLSRVYTHVRAHVLQEIQTNEDTESSVEKIARAEEGAEVESSTNVQNSQQAVMETE